MSKSYSNNKSLRSGIVLTIIAFITLICMCGTFAKYITNGNFDDQARVAKWGIDVQGGATSLFDARYTSPDDSSVTVEAANGKDHLIAPGTEKFTDLMLISITGNAPEVMYDFDVNFRVTDATSADASSSTIAKLDELAGWTWWYSVDGGTTKYQYATHAEIEQALNSLSKKHVSPNALPWSWIKPNAVSKIKVGWKWDFEKDGNAAWDKADTLLGNMAADGLLDNLKVSLNVGATQCLEQNVDNVTVSFDTNGGSKNPDAQIIEKGQKAIEPKEPVKGGSTFLGWTDGEGNYWDFDEGVNESMILYANWESTTSYTLSFNATGCDAPDPITDISPNTTFTTSGNTLTLSDGQSVTVSPDSEHRGIAVWDPSSGKIIDDTVVNVSFEEKEDPDIEVPADTQVVDADSSIECWVLKQSDASWNEPSSSNPSIATAEWTEEGLLQINGLSVGDATITVSLPATDSYKAGSKTISVKVKTNEKKEAKAKVDASSEDTDASIDSIDSKNLFDEYKAELHADVKKAQDTAKKEIDEAKTLLANSSAIDAALAKFAAAIKEIEKKIPIFIDETKSAKDASSADASAQVKQQIDDLKKNEALYKESIDKFEQDFKDILTEIIDRINNSWSKKILNDDFGNFLSKMSDKIGQIEFDSKIQWDDKIDKETTIEGKFFEIEILIDEIDNLTQVTKEAYISSVEASQKTAVDNVYKAYNKDAAQEIVNGFFGTAQEIYQKAQEQADRPWDASWPLSIREITVEHDGSASLDASAYVKMSDPYYDKAPDVSYSLESAPEGFSINKGEGGLPFIYVDSDVEPDEYTITVVATFVAIPDFGAETVIRVDNIKVTVTSSVKHKSLYRNGPNWTYAPVFANGKGAKDYGLHFYDNSSSTEELTVNTMADLKDKVGPGNKNLYYEIDASGGQKGDGKLYAIRSTARHWDEIKDKDIRHWDKFHIYEYNFDDAFGDHWVGLDWRGEGEDDDFSQPTESIILKDKYDNNIGVGTFAQEGTVYNVYGRNIVSGNQDYVLSCKCASNSGQFWVWDPIKSAYIMIPTGPGEETTGGVLFSRAFE